MEQLETRQTRTGDDAGAGDEDRGPVAVLEQVDDVADPQAGDDFGRLFEIGCDLTHAIGQLRCPIDNDDARAGPGDEAVLGLRQHYAGSFRRS